VLRGRWCKQVWSGLTPELASRTRRVRNTRQGFGMTTAHIDPTPAITRSRMGLRAMLTLFTAAALAVTAIVGAISLWGASQAGDAATRTFVAKDVTADILPPPMY